MFCPTCKSEYRPGFDKCVDCGVSLVESLPNDMAPDRSELLAVLTTPDAASLPGVTASLDAAGIPYVVQDKTERSGQVVAELLVPQDRYEEAFALLNDELAPEFELETEEKSGGTRDIRAVRVKERYSDAYAVASVVVGFGAVIKVVGVVVGVVILVVSLRADFWGSSIGGLLLGSATGLFFYLLGVIVAAQGQILRATLDTAVNTSPFLSDRQKENMIIDNGHRM
jgi:hypothetical protein